MIKAPLPFPGLEQIPALERATPEDAQALYDDAHLESGHKPDIGGLMEQLREVDQAISRLQLEAQGGYHDVAISHITPEQRCLEAQRSWVTIRLIHQLLSAQNRRPIDTFALGPQAEKPAVYPTNSSVEEMHFLLQMFQGTDGSDWEKICAAQAPHSNARMGMYRLMQLASSLRDQCCHWLREASLVEANPPDYKAFRERLLDRYMDWQANQKTWGNKFRELPLLRQLFGRKPYNPRNEYDLKVLAV